MILILVIYLFRRCMQQIINLNSGEIVPIKSVKQACQLLGDMQKFKKMVEEQEKTLKEYILKDMDVNNSKMLENEGYFFKRIQRQNESYNFWQVTDIFEKLDRLDEVLKPDNVKIKRLLKDLGQSGDITAEDIKTLNSTKSVSWSNPYLTITKK